MTPEAIGERAARVLAVRADVSPDSARIASAFIDVRSIRAWADAQEAALIAQLRSVESFPEAAIADANRCSVGAASKTTERSETLTSTPTLADALEEGSITAGHVDSVTRRSKKLDDEHQRKEFLDRADSLAAVAAAGTIEQFGKRLDLEVKKLQTDDGEGRLVRQSGRSGSRAGPTTMACGTFGVASIPRPRSGWPLDSMRRRRHCSPSRLHRTPRAIRSRRTASSLRMR